MLKQHIDSNNLHHAYLIEGEKSFVLLEIYSILEDLNIKIKGNPDLSYFEYDSFKIDDARKLKTLTSDKGFSEGIDSKKIFIISANSFLLEAQNSLLKVFEEPISNTHFFIITPSHQSFIPTLLSRFYLIKDEHSADGSLNQKENTDNAKSFIDSSFSSRIDFLKKLLAVDKKDEENDIDAPRTRALNFLNYIEHALHKKVFSAEARLPQTSELAEAGLRQIEVFEQILKVRKYLRQPGSSAKMLMESVSLAIPEKI